MQKALSSDLKTAAAPARKKYPSRHIRFSQKISTLPAMTETFGKYPLDRFSRNSQKISPRPPYPKLSEISPSPAFPEIRRKYPSRPL